MYLIFSLMIYLANFRNIVKITLYACDILRILYLLMRKNNPGLCTSALTFDLALGTTNSFSAQFLNIVSGIWGRAGNCANIAGSCILYL